MEKLKVAKVENALLQRNQKCTSGTLHLTQHHLIFVKSTNSTITSANESGEKTTEGVVSTASSSSSPEEWIPYPLIWLASRLPSVIPLDQTGKPNRAAGKRIFPIALHLRNFELITIGLDADSKATDVFESMKAVIVADAPQSLYAFYHNPTPPLKSAPAGWRVYDFKAEFARQGIATRTKAWRFCDVNAGYGFCYTYPAMLCVPSRISDSTIRYASKFRSKERIPALTYLHRGSLASITRSSQPMVGLNNRSMQDEKLIEAIFSSHLFADPLSQTAQAATAAANNATQSGNAVTERGKAVAIYGATTTNLIIDARPTTNAMANRAKGAGTENMDNYRGCKKVYLGIDNIHVMRDSLQRVTEALRAAQAPATFGMQAVAAEQLLATEDIDGRKRRRSSVLTAQDSPPLDHLALKRSAWLKHISALMEGTLIITRNVHINNSHVLIHCSDGWDRTSQLSALAQVCLDPYFRTMKGFAVLIEKDWISFGHRFWDRCGHASSEKYFTLAEGYGANVDNVENDDQRNSTDSEEDGAGEGFDAQAAANAFWGFTKQLRANFQGGDGNSKRGAHLKEISPVFHQFLDCVWQIMRQYPKRFEFNEQWLLDLYDNVFRCQYGNFLFNCESERNGYSDGQSNSAPASSSTYSVWDEMLDEENRSKYLNSRFEPALDDEVADRSQADLGVLLPNSKDVGFWGGLFRRDSKDINHLVQAEAEERKRLLEAQAKQREEDAAAAEEAQRSAVGPSEVDGVTVGPMIAAGENDPVLRPGIVDVQKFDSNKLAYKPRTRQSNPPKSANSPEVHGNGRPLPTQALRRENTGDDFGVNAQEAANKMKNMFLGWGAKLQDAYATATSPAFEEGGGGGGDNLPRVLEAPASSAQWKQSSTKSNPWATTEEANVSRYEGLPNTLHNDLNPWNDRSAQKPIPRVQTNGQEVQKALPTYPKQEDEQEPIVKNTPPPKEIKEEQKDYDPLGVGFS
ncbi:hypothetical protein L7F22_003114 [Adiantum nelumboides]|nr:hypothetical protein [Adiantum nelumboides]